MHPKPFAPSCERNQSAILEVLKLLLVDTQQVLEIGSGTGQHAVYFARHMPWLSWQPSDQADKLSGMGRWLEEAGLGNVRPPLVLDVAQNPWPPVQADAVFSANTAHIMSWLQVERFIAGVGQILPKGGIFCLYGPFNYGGEYTSEGNAGFDASLRAENPARGLRDVEAIQALAQAAGLQLQSDTSMPANNHLLCWRKD